MTHPDPLTRAVQAALDAAAAYVKGLQVGRYSDGQWSHPNPEAIRAIPVAEVLAKVGEELQSDDRANPANITWLAAMGVVAGARNKLGAGPGFELLNKVMGDMEEIRRRCQKQEAPNDRA